MDKKYFCDIKCGPVINIPPSQSLIKSTKLCDFTLWNSPGWVSLYTLSLLRQRSVKHLSQSHTANKCLVT